MIIRSILMPQYKRNKNGLPGKGNPLPKVKGTENNLTFAELLEKEKDSWERKQKQ